MPIIISEKKIISIKIICRTYTLVMYSAQAECFPTRLIASLTSAINVIRHVIIIFFFYINLIYRTPEINNIQPVDCVPGHLINFSLLYAQLLLYWIFVLFYRLDKRFILLIIRIICMYICIIYIFLLCMHVYLCIRSFTNSSYVHWTFVYSCPSVIRLYPSVSFSVLFPLTLRS